MQLHFVFDRFTSHVSIAFLTAGAVSGNRAIRAAIARRSAHLLPIREAIKQHRAGFFLSGAVFPAFLRYTSQLNVCLTLSGRNISVGVCYMLSHQC
jgi:hypothetical protein